MNKGRADNLLIEYRQILAQIRELEERAERVQSAWVKMRAVDDALATEEFTTRGQQDPRP